jgi:hypothetical protein
LPNHGTAHAGLFRATFFGPGNPHNEVGNNLRKVSWRTSFQTAFLAAQDVLGNIERECGQVGENSVSWRQVPVVHDNSNGDENRQADGRMKPNDKALPANGDYIWSSYKRPLYLENEE